MPRSSSISSGWRFAIDRLALLHHKTEGPPIWSRSLARLSSSHLRVFLVRGKWPHFEIALCISDCINEVALEIVIAFLYVYVAAWSVIDSQMCDFMWSCAHCKQIGLNYNAAVLTPKLFLFYKQGCGWIEQVFRWIQAQTQVLIPSIWGCFTKMYPWRGWITLR